jgi:hypothetical protein
LRFLFDFHRVFGYVAIVANAIVGVLALIAWRVRRFRGRWLWTLTVVAESMLLLQVLAGAALVVSEEYPTPPRFHMFYGFLAFLTIGLAYQYRRLMRGRREMFYGLVGLFLMGLGIRAVLEASSP